MKKQILAIGLAVASLCSTALAQQATNQPPANSGSFFQTTVGYFSAFNTNYDSTFTQNRGQVWTGVNAIQGGKSSLANEIGISYDVWRPKSTTNNLGNIALSLESVTRNGGVTGSLISQGVGAGVSFVVHDVCLTAYVDGVYQFDDDKLGAEFGLRVFKALTEHTFAGVGIAEQVPNNIQIFSAFVGFRF